MKTVKRYELDLSLHSQRVPIPKNAKFIHVAYKLSLFIWAIVDTENDVEDHLFIIYENDDEVRDLADLVYIGSTSTSAHNNSSDYHVFEKR